MKQDFEDSSALWRQCETAWSAWLEANNDTVVHLNEAVGNATGTLAPLISIAGKRRRAPDFLSTKAGRSEFWEVKFRGRVDYDPLTGERVHWTSLEAYQDYLATANNSACKVWLVVYEAPSATTEGRWLRAEVRALVGPGRTEMRYDGSGTEIAAWIWPAAAMEVVSGPVLNLDNGKAAVLPDEGAEAQVSLTDLMPRERLRRRLRGPDPDGIPTSQVPATADPAARLVENDPAIGLHVLSNSLGLPVVPGYSVLRVGLDGIDVDDLLGLLEYGIRVFIISKGNCPHSLDSIDFEAFRTSRLLEWAILADDIEETPGTWIIDGTFPDPLSFDLDNALAAADRQGGFNRGQFEIVHAPADASLLVAAGAGTGKTETMSERVLFLLATSRGVEGSLGSPASHPYDLRLDDVAFVTFTREAAREMRDRIGGTLMLRRRLCRLCVLPVLAWMTQLSTSEVETIHTFSKHIVQAGGGALGVAPSLRVAQRTIEFRRIFHSALSPHLARLVEEYGSRVPPAHIWQDHVESIWSTMENNGVELMSIADPSVALPIADWGSSGANGLVGAVEQAIYEVICEVAPAFRDESLDNQSIRLSQLVPVAIATLKATVNPRVKRLRYLFVDEFQDTDASQMELILEIQSRLSTTLFVVGDAKQGIYRFRGAEGNAFDQLESRVAKRRAARFLPYSLNRNFRSGAQLLESLHPHFERWGSAQLLAYKESEKLRPAAADTDNSERLRIETVSPKADIAKLAAEDVASWVGEAERLSLEQLSIAILCRQNWQAGAVQQELQGRGLPCELLVGGSFFASPAVRELDVFLSAVAQSSNDAALLQLCETRWATRILSGVPPHGVPISDWLSELSPPLAWTERIASLAKAEEISRLDLEPIRLRVKSLRTLLDKMPVIAWIVECARTLAPETSFSGSSTDATEQRRYARCLDHLITLLDGSFKDGAVSLERVRSWLQLQIATNRKEDEPVEWGELKGRTTALTVHKAKGLEFDRVLIPYTGMSFGGSGRAKTKVAILRDVEEKPRIIWKWKPGKNFREFSNVSPNNQGLWVDDARETSREEARLLYVAMTRAKDRLLIYRSSSARMTPQPQSWAELLNL